MNETIRILRLDASANLQQSTSRELGDRLQQELKSQHGAVEIRHRDLNREAQFIDADWIHANLSDPASRDEAMRDRLARSDELIAELEWADHVILTTPMYNFGVPATLKAWIDQVCRAGITFRYTPEGPRGLLQGKQADIVITTGGAPLESPVDFVSGYLRQVFGFIGIDAVNVIGADRMNVDAEQSLAAAQRQIDKRFTAAAA